MGVDIITRKYFNQLRNGGTFSDNVSDYTNFLQGSICEKICCETTVDVWWKSYSQQYIDEWQTVTSAGVCTVTRQLNSFLTDGFRSGDTIIWTDGMYGTGTGTITSVNALTMVIGSFTGSLPDGARTSMVIWGTTSLTAIIFQHNLIENDEAENYISKVDGNTLSFAGSGLTNSDTLLVKQGNFNSWLDTGSIFVRTGTSGDSTKQRFIITSTFFITPFYLPSQYNDLQNGISPDYLKDVASLKYISRYEFRQSLFNPNLCHIGSDTLMLGSVSWFDEHFNGFTPVEFTKESIAYSVSGAAVDELQISETTHVIIEINSANNVFVDAQTKFILNLFKLPVDESEHKNTVTTMFENYVFDRCFQTVNVSTGVGEQAILTNILSSIVSNRLHIEFDVTFTTAQQALIEDRQYIISVMTDDHTLAHASSKEINVLCDYNTFANSIENPNLLSVSYCKFWEHPFNPSIANTGTKDFKGWITDGVYNETKFSCVGGVLNYLKIKVRAKNSSTLENFDLMEYDLDLSSYPIIAGVRTVSIDTTRGFKLIAGSIQNLVYFKSTGLVMNEYELKFGFKLRWADWLQLINADSDFYNTSLLNNGLSEKWSNYSDAVTYWGLEILVIPTIEDDITGSETDFNIISNLKCHNYNEDGNAIPLWTGSIETFKGAVSLGVDGNALYSEDTDTKIVATFTSISSILTATLYGIIYIEQYQQGGIYNQWQLSTEELPATGNWLKPVTGQTKCKLTVVNANTVTLEAMIDHTKVNGQISIAARIGYGCQDIAEIRASGVYTIVDVYGLINNCAYVDVTINSVLIAFNVSIPPPYGVALFTSTINGVSGGYDVFPSDTTTAKCEAPAGLGSTANGYTVSIILKNIMGFSLGEFIFTLSGGVDEYECPHVIIPTFRILQEDNFYLLQENGDYLLTE